MILHPDADTRVPGITAAVKEADSVGDPLGKYFAVDGLRDISDLDQLPFKPHYIHASSPQYSPHFSYVTSWENLIKHQEISSLVSISFIL